MFITKPHLEEEPAQSCCLFRFELDLQHLTVLLFPPAASGRFASRPGRHAPAHADDLDALRQQLSEGRLLLQKMEAGLLSLSASQEVHLQQVS